MKNRTKAAIGIALLLLTGAAAFFLLKPSKTGVKSPKSGNQPDANPQTGKTPKEKPYGTDWSRSPEAMKERQKTKAQQSKDGIPKVGKSKSDKNNNSNTNQNDNQNTNPYNQNSYSQNQNSYSQNYYHQSGAGSYGLGGSPSGAYDYVP
jgi:hypothetical protein